MTLGGPELLFILVGPDLIIILIVAILFFGGKKIPDLAKGLGQGIRNFKGAVKSEDESNEQKKL
ncbi:MAG: twin-arginine translocase TatA/TatE family subunit [Bryobacteraceae bacterium]